MSVEGVPVVYQPLDVLPRERPGVDADAGRMHRPTPNSSTRNDRMSDPPTSSPVPSDEILTTNVREEGIDDALRVLADHERRYICYYLHREGSLAVDDLARFVAATMADGRPDADDLTSTAVSLRHVHLPTLADAGVVVYDREAGTARLAEDAPFVRELLSVTGVELE